MRSNMIFSKLNLSVSCGLLGLTMMTVAFTAPSLHAQKRRIAVMALDVSPDAKQKAATQLGVQNDIGETLAAGLIDGLTKEGKYAIFERAALDKIIKEQNFSNSDRADQNTAVKLGKLAGVDAIVIGQVTQFGGESSSQGVSIPIKIHGIPVPMSNKKKTSTVTVGLTVRMIDTSTGLILASANGTGTSTKSTSEGSTAGVTTTSDVKEFGTPAINDATTQAIMQIVAQIDAAPMPTAAVAPPPPPPPAAPAAPKVSYKAIVADVSGNTLTLNVGTKGGVQVGDVVEVVRLGAPIKDPTTGKILRYKSEKLGPAKITQADATSSEATYSGTEVVKVKDQVNSQP